MDGSQHALRSLFTWPFARAGAVRLATAQTEEDVAEYLADALGELRGNARMLVTGVAEEFGISFARERYATTVAVETEGGMQRADGRRYTASTVFLRLCREALGEEWERVYQPPNERGLRAAAVHVLERVVPKWRMPPAPRGTSRPDRETTPNVDRIVTPYTELEPITSPNSVEITEPQTVLGACAVVRRSRCEPARRRRASG